MTKKTTLEKFLWTALTKMKLVSGREGTHTPVS